MGETNRRNLFLPATSLALKRYEKMVEKGLGESGVHTLGEMY